MSSQKKVAVVLSGCGVYDGSEIHEASSCLIHLSREGSTVSMFAPDTDQVHVINHLNGQEMQEKRCLIHLSREGSTVSMFAPDTDQVHVINHLNGQEMQEKRNVLTESARIARGKASPLSQLRAGDFDAVIFPGGFGAAKNLSDFATRGKDCSALPDAQRVLTEFHRAGKPIGLCCIAPVLAARVLPGCQVTMGSESEEGGRWPHAGATQAVAPMGGKHVVKDVTECHVDAANKLVTTPAFMCEAPLHQIYEGIGAMIREVVKMA